jgi:hypothetical protein
MAAFLVFLSLMTVCVVGGVLVSTRFYKLSRTGYLSERQLVTLSQEALIEGRPSRRRTKVDMGMRECARRAGGVSLGVLSVMILLIVMFIDAGH